MATGKPRFLQTSALRPVMTQLEMSAQELEETIPDAPVFFSPDNDPLQFEGLSLRSLTGRMYTCGDPVPPGRDCVASAGSTAVPRIPLRTHLHLCDAHIILYMQIGSHKYGIFTFRVQSLGRAHILTSKVCKTANAYSAKASRPFYHTKQEHAISRA